MLPFYRMNLLRLECKVNETCYWDEWLSFDRSSRIMKCKGKRNQEGGRGR